MEIASSEASCSLTLYKHILESQDRGEVDREMSLLILYHFFSCSYEELVNRNRDQSVSDYKLFRVHARANIEGIDKWCKAMWIVVNIKWVSKTCRVNKNLEQKGTKDKLSFATPVCFGL
ncbi:hypothetical protein YC2023_018654 [Brassica napus]